jgi:hypothetical protein
MTTHQLLVFSNPAEGHEDEYNQWYDTVHLGEVLQVPGFMSAQRYRIDLAPGSPVSQRYLAVYEVEADNPSEVLSRLGAARSSMNMSDAFDPSSTSALVVSPVGERQTSGAAGAPS